MSESALSFLFRGPEGARPALVDRSRSALNHAVDGLFCGSVATTVYAALRVGLASIFLVRHADWLRPWVFLEHHRFVRGLMFLESGAAAEPALVSPMIPGFSLSDTATRWLVYARTLLAVFLLLGVRARAAALGLALVSYALLAADRFRYYHHLHLLYVSIAFLALAPIGASFSVERIAARLLRRVRGLPDVSATVSSAPSPAWPLQLVRALVIGVYAAAFASKLDPSFLRGDVLRGLERFHVLKGWFWELVRDVVGYRGVATLAGITEIALPLLLLLRPTRRLAVLLALGFHAGISACMPVYSFGAQMAVLLVAFLPRRTVAPLERTS
jgi:hypothetical protein